MRCKPKARVSHAFNSLQDLVDAFINSEKDLETRNHYKALSDDEAIERAARLQVRNRAGNGWKRHPHFHRRWLYTKEFLQSLDQAASILKNNKKSISLKLSSSFDEAHLLVSQLLKEIPKLGELAYYDITELLGYHWNVEPNSVYLHAGTRTGAEELFGKRNCVAPVLRNELVAKLNPPLRPAEIEDFLCDFSEKIALLRSRRKLPSWSYS